MSLHLETRAITPLPALNGSRPVSVRYQTSTFHTGGCLRGSPQ